MGDESTHPPTRLLCHMRHQQQQDIGAKRVKAMLGVMRQTFAPEPGTTERQQQQQRGSAGKEKEVDAFEFLFDPRSFTQVMGGRLLDGWMDGWWWWW